MGWTKDDRYTGRGNQTGFIGTNLRHVELGMVEDDRKELNWRDKKKILHRLDTIEFSGVEETWDDRDSIATENFDREQVEEICKTQLNFLAALCMPDQFTVEFSPTHLTMWQILLEMEQDSTLPFPQLALGIPRGHAKTTLIKLFIVHMILFSTRKFILVAASTQDRAMDIVSDVWDMLQEGNMKSVFGDCMISVDTDTKSLKKFAFRGRSITIAAIGAEGSIRGINIQNARPDCIVMDDIQSKDCADSALQSKTLIEWMVGTLMKAKDQRRCLFIFAGNMFPTPHSILKQLKVNSTWIKFISGAILADGKAIWPAYRSLDSLIQELNNDISMNQAHIFFSEVLNDTSVGINSTVDYSRFPDWPWQPTDLPQGKFIIIDPSQGKGKDYDVLVMVEVYDGRAGIRHVVEEHFSPLILIKQALILAIQNEIYCIAVESMAYQATLLFWFEEVCRQLNISGITFVPIYTTTMAKNSRISSAIKAMQTTELYLHPSVRSRVTAQIADWNPMKKENVDDILDAISHAQKVIAEYTYDIMAKGNLLLTDAAVHGVVEDNHAF